MHPLATDPTPTKRVTSRPNSVLAVAVVLTAFQMSSSCFTPFATARVRVPNFEVAQRTPFVLYTVQRTFVYCNDTHFGADSKVHSHRSHMAHGAADDKTNLDAFVYL